MSNPLNTQIINLLNDGETFTDANNCQILGFTEDDIGRWATGEEIEEALDAEQFSHVVSFEVVDGALTIFIHDESGVPVIIRDERTFSDTDDVMVRASDAFPRGELGGDNEGQLVVYTGLYEHSNGTVALDPEEL